MSFRFWIKAVYFFGGIKNNFCCVLKENIVEIRWNPNRRKNHTLILREVSCQTKNLLIQTMIPKLRSKFYMLLLYFHSNFQSDNIFKWYNFTDAKMFIVQQTRSGVHKLILLEKYMIIQIIDTYDSLMFHSSHFCPSLYVEWL